VYGAARHFHVSPTMMKNVMKALGLVSMVDGHIRVPAQGSIEAGDEIERI